MEFEAVIGLEVHAQLSTKTKLWCSCGTKYNAPANSQVCPVCIGLPGALPVLNRRAVDFSVRLGLAIEAEIKEYSEFSRKNYFYQDLPNGYQITQYEYPIIENGKIKVDVGDVGEDKYQIEIRIQRAHIENDTGKTIHDDEITGKDKSFVDFNRSGMPLIEIVTHPDFKTAKEANYYLQRLRQVLRILEICDGNMEEGSLRCDANVSIMEKGTKVFGTRTEVKNMNSFKNVERAINYEIERQKKVIESGGKIKQETRMWDAQESKTVSMRSKEDAMDYRYFPEPDLLPLKISNEYIQKIKKEIPELPHIKRDRFINDYQLSVDDANTLTSSTSIANYFEKLVSLTADAKLSSNWILSEALRVVNELAIDLSDFKISEERLSELILLIKDQTISGKIAKTVFEEMLHSDDSAAIIIERKGFVQISDANSIEKICQDVVDANPDQTAEYKAGRDKLFDFFVGQVMKVSKGQANPQMVNETLKKLLA
jgi:aspartyl-tRNA(Asn)/glutamyl-tRNA(Gln) amidotransferase subunit B